jgi:hypothetical protein
MNIELKKLKIVKQLSQETICFYAELYIDGKRRGYCENDGHGGCTEIHGYTKEDNEIIEKCNEYCKTTLPKVSYGSDKEYEQNLEDVINKLVDNEFNSSQRKRDMKKGLCVQKDNGFYNIVTWKKHTIESLLKHPQGKDVLIKKIQEYKDKGFKILNTNIPNELLSV